MKKCRVFTTNIGWSEVMFIFDVDITFSEISKHTQTQMLTKSDFIGTYEFDKNFINCFERSQIGNKYYFYKFSYQKDEPQPEEKEWKKLSEPKNPSSPDIEMTTLF